MSRRYEDLWKRLANNPLRSLKIRVKRGLSTKRLVKGVYNEKALDKEISRKWRLETKIEGDIVIFSMRRKINLLNV